MLGFEATNLANEELFLAIPKNDARKAIEVLHTFSEASNVCIIGTVTQQYSQKSGFKLFLGNKKDF